MSGTEVREEAAGTSRGSYPEDRRASSGDADAGDEALRR